MGQNDGKDVGGTESVCPIFRATSPLSRGRLKSKGHGKLSIHYSADLETIETIFRIIVSANQLSLNGAVAEMCEEDATIDRRNPLWEEGTDFGQPRFGHRPIHFLAIVVLARPILAKANLWIWSVSWWSPEGWGPNSEKVALKGGAPQGGALQGGGPKCRALFSLSRSRFALFVSLGPKAAGVSQDSPRAQTWTFEGPGLQKDHQNSTIRHTQREKRNENGAGEGTKKERHYGRSNGGAVRQMGTRCAQHTTTQQNKHYTPNNITKWIGQKQIGQNWPNHEPLVSNIGQNWIGQRPQPPAEGGPVENGPGKSKPTTTMTTTTPNPE